MIIFSTKLYVKESLTNELFVNMTLDWAAQSPNYSFNNLSWNNKDEYYVESSDKLQTLNIIKYNDTIMVHLTNKDSNNVLWTNDYVLTTRGNKRVLSVQLYRDAEDISTKLPSKFNRPRLLKTIIQNGYGDFDRDLAISDKCLMITEDNIDIIKRVILNEEEYMMPIVHITPQFKNSNFIINYKELAKDLAGVAHVLVDKNYSITNQLKDLTNGKNPYNGGVQIYFCKGVSKRILPINTEIVFRKQVAYSVFRRLVLSKIDDDLSWSKLRIKKIVENKKQNEKEHGELLKLYDEEINTKDNEIEFLTEQIEALESENTAYLAKIKSLEQHLDNSKSSDSYTTGIVLSSQEYDFFDDEQKNTVLTVLEKEFELMKLTPNQKETRKFHILNSILQQNSIVDTSAEIKKQFRSVFADNATLNATMKKAIGHLGFEIEDGKHYKLKYNGDDRYIFTMSKTPGDGRSMKNLRTQILRVLFNTTD